MKKRKLFEKENLVCTQCGLPLELWIGDGDVCVCEDIDEEDRAESIGPEFYSDDGYDAEDDDTY